MAEFLPQILIIDDLFGRLLREGRNNERAQLCAQYRIEDITGDEAWGHTARVARPVAQAMFHRGQTPICAGVADHVENDLESILEVVGQGWGNKGRLRWALVLLDLCFYTGTVTTESNRKVQGMPEGRDEDEQPRHYFGLQIIEALHQKFPDLPVVILSSKSRREVSREFSHNGAFDFLDRHEGGAEQLQGFIRRYGLIPDETGKIIGSTKAVLLMLRAARQAAFQRRNVLLRGERGTGKELMARYIHEQENFGSKKKLIEVNSASLLTEVALSELFGHEKGGFTGAISQKQGLISLAEGSNIFLDEIKDMPVEIQAAILRTIEYREIRPVGGNPKNVEDVRFISATNTDIEALAATEKFRPDLLDRLREGGSIYLPPLRERKEDIPIIAEGFVRAAEARTRGAVAREIDQGAMEKLISHDWPGNVRELRDCIFAAVGKYPGVEYLMPLHIALPPEDKTSPKGSRMRLETIPVPPHKASYDEMMTIDEVIQMLDTFNFKELAKEQAQGRLKELEKAMVSLKMRYLVAALERTRGVVDSKVSYTRAVKWMTGQKQLTRNGKGEATKASRMINDLLRECEKYHLEITDPLLQSLFVTHLRSDRPKATSIDELKEETESA